MKVCLSEDDDGNILVEARFEGEGIEGDASSTVEPDGSFFGIPFTELQEMGSGEHEIEVE